MRNTLAHAGKSGRRVVAAFIATAFAQNDAVSARAQWRQVADQVRAKLPKLAALLDAAEADVLAFMTFPKEHRAKIHSTNPIELRSAMIPSSCCPPWPHDRPGQTRRRPRSRHASYTTPWDITLLHHSTGHNPTLSSDLKSGCWWPSFAASPYEAGRKTKSTQ